MLYLTTLDFPWATETAGGYYLLVSRTLASVRSSTERVKLVQRADHLVGVIVSVVSLLEKLAIHPSDRLRRHLASVWYEAVTVGRPQVPEKDQQVRDNKVYPSEVSNHPRLLVIVDSFIHDIYCSGTGTPDIIPRAYDGQTMLESQ